MNKINVFQKVNLVPSLPLDFFGDKTLVPKKSSEEEEDSKALINFLSTIDDPTVNDAKEEEDDDEDEDEEVRRSEQDNAETSLYRARYEALKTIREGRGSKRKLDNDIIEDKDKEELNSLFANIESIKSISKVIKEKLGKGRKVERELETIAKEAEKVEENDELYLVDFRRRKQKVLIQER